MNRYRIEFEPGTCLIGEFARLHEPKSGNAVAVFPLRGKVDVGKESAIEDLPHECARRLRQLQVAPEMEELAKELLDSFQRGELPNNAIGVAHRILNYIETGKEI